MLSLSGMALSVYKWAINYAIDFVNLLYMYRNALMKNRNERPSQREIEISPQYMIDDHVRWILFGRHKFVYI